MGKTKNNAATTAATSRQQAVAEPDSQQQVVAAVQSAKAGQRPQQPIVSFRTLRGSGGRPPGAAPPESAQESPADSEQTPLSAQEVLERFDQRLFDHDPKRRGLIIDRGTTLQRPEKNNREYRGLVRIAPRSDGGIEYQGVTQYGPAGRVGSHEKIVYRGEDPHSAASEVNKMIRKKVDKGGYQAINPQEPEEVDGRQALIAAGRLIA